jgi:hypothetical protein
MYLKETGWKGMHSEYGPVMGSREYGNKLTSSIKCSEISPLPKEILASQDAVCDLHS